MKKRIAFAAIAAPVGFAAYIALHPGIAYAEPAYANAANAVPFSQSGEYSVDPAHTSIGFEINHMGLANIQGRFNKHSGTLNVNHDDLTKSSVEFTIETTSIDTAVTARDNHLRTADFFEVEKYPEIKFKSTAIRKADKGYVADGQLTMKGVTKSISIPFTHYGPIVNEQGSRIGVVAEPIKLNRRDFGINYGQGSIGDEVTIRLSLEAIKKPSE